jgi:SAM-dependent MidA family methyltransferase
MPGETSMADVLRNMLQYGDLSFRDFMEVALYHPELGYYTGQAHPAGKAGDFVTAPTLSPAFSFAIARLVREFSSRFQGEVCSFVDIGAGEGGLVTNVESELRVVRPSGLPFLGERQAGGPHYTFFSVDRVRGTSLDDVPREGVHLIFSSELYDAFPFARLVQRGEHLHELWVAERDGGLDWVEREAPAVYEGYFAERGIALAEGQFVDLSLEWEAFHREVVERFERALFVTFDYGHPAEKLFSSRMRRFGTAAAYSGHRVSRDLLANPGEQDLTAHINFSDLQRAPATTLYFDRMNRFLLALGITEHPSFREETDFQAREDARRLVLPDGIGEDLRVLVQGKNVPVEGWSFQRHLY